MCIGDSCQQVRTVGIIELAKLLELYTNPKGGRANPPLSECKIMLGHFSWAGSCQQS